MELLLVPLIGPFHLRSPTYNAVSVRDTLAAWQPDQLATTALTPGELGHPAWQDTPELALPLAVVPWASRTKLPLMAIGEPSPEANAQEDFQRYLEPYPQLRSELAQVERLMENVASLLEKPLSAERIAGELLPALEEHQQTREALFGDGPASDWLRSRMETVARRALALEAGRLALLAPVEHIPILSGELRHSGATIAPLPATPTSPEARERALLDYAFRQEAAEAGALLEHLHELPGAEARYHEANLLLASGHGFEALELLEKTSHGDFSEPYFLPGYLLARLGQLRDLDSRRDDALRAYRGVLALDYAPAEAIEAARSGLESPFSP